MNKKQSIWSLFLGTVLGLQGCGTRNVADCDEPTAGIPCSPRTKDEDARIALDNGQLDTAVTLLKELVAEDPNNYERYPLLAAALAGRAGFDIFNVIRADFGGGNSLLQTMGAFLPTPTSRGSAYASSLSDMNESVNTLRLIPEALRADATTDDFAASCVLQITLYQSAYSIMLINQFTYGANGFDPSMLSTMTAADAALILQNLLAAGSVVPGSNAAAANTAVTKAYQSIQGQEGANDQEKIAAYVKASR